MALISVFATRTLDRLPISTLERYLSRRICTKELVAEVLRELHARKADGALSAHAHTRLVRIARTKLAAARGTSDRRFKWPQMRMSGFGGSGITRLDAEVARGILKHVGYTVGRESGTVAQRRSALRKAFTTVFADAQLPRHYLEAWGGPSSAKRLYRMAASIAAFGTLATGRSASLELAIGHWEEDLAWLYRELYVGYFGWR